MKAIKHAEVDASNVDLGRRSFLVAARTGGAVAAVAVMIGKSVAAGAAEAVIETVDPPSGGGYRETEHIRTYYRTARYW